MRAVHFLKTMRCPPRTAQPLNVTMLLVGQIVPLDVEFERAAESDVEHLKTLANRQNWQPSGERVLDSPKLPTVTLRVDLFIQHRRVRNVLLQKFRRNIGAA